MKVTQDYINHLADKYINTVLRISYTYLGNRADAEDTVQDVFLQIIDKKPEFNDETHEKAWIVRTTVNMCKNKLNLFWNKNKISIDDAQDFAVYDEYDTGSEVLKAVLSPPPKYRIVIYMYYYEGYSTPEIAKLTSQNDSTVRSLMRRAKDKLKNILKEGYDFE